VGAGGRRLRSRGRNTSHGADAEDLREKTRASTMTITVSVSSGDELKSDACNNAVTETGGSLLSNFNSLIPTLSVLDGFHASNAELLGAGDMAYHFVNCADEAVLQKRSSMPSEFFEDAVLVYNEPFAKLVSTPDAGSRRAADNICPIRDNESPQASMSPQRKKSERRGALSPLKAENLIQKMMGRGSSSGKFAGGGSLESFHHAASADVIMEVQPRRHPLPTSVLAAAVEASELYTKDIENDTDAKQSNSKQRARRGASARVDAGGDPLKASTVFESECGKFMCTVGPPSMPGSVIVKSGDISNDKAALIDAKRARRIIANRQSAQRSKERKQNYVSALEKEVEELKTRAKVLETKLSAIEHDNREAVNVRDNALVSLDESEKRLRLMETVNETLRREVEHLRQANKAICAVAANEHAMEEEVAADHRLYDNAGDVQYRSQSLKRSTSGSILMALERALEQSAKNFEVGGLVPGADRYLTSSPPADGANWLADFSIEAASPVAQAFAANPSVSKCKGIKRKNTAP